MLDAGAQVRAVQEYVRELLDQEQKFLIFAHHKVLLDGIQEVLNKRGPYPTLPYHTLPYPTLIFAHHKVLLDGIQEVLNKRGPTRCLSRDRCRRPVYMLLLSPQLHSATMLALSSQVA